ncbi:MAG: PhzF family phenazine biosynthesis protein [Cypionkella sp.]|uniref:PhzF family phenazine biosynthesis protein n=1 Tax=Cypionkella sp. TaxID=2811411 RepID=UPI002636B6A1|nr:PhzF family phenazine biosynthesis protein [Cypionkella sp.]MDB5658198.1 PhzF family phenazine biosynthesis protein [Cypionkella sp.]
MQIERIAAFALGDQGGNPAGVVIGDALPAREDMQRIAREVGYSETAFASRDGDHWQVRYFAPESEVPFCGHATIALGCALGQRFGAGRYELQLSGARISVEAVLTGAGWQATLTSPPTWSKPMPAALLAELLPLFHLTPADLDASLAPHLAHAGATHAVLALHNRATLAAMAYDFPAVLALMQREAVTTVSLIYREDADTFVARNAFAVGGVVEDPATGAAAAALGGLLVDLGRGASSFAIRQGEDMGAPSLLHVSVSGQKGAAVRVSGAARLL